MRESDYDVSARVTSAFLIGGLLGATALALLTPLNGRQTRARIKAQGRALKRRLDEGVDDVREGTEKVGEKVDTMRRQAGETLSDVNHSIEYEGDKLAKKAEQQAQKARRQ